MCSVCSLSIVDSVNRVNSTKHCKQIIAQCFPHLWWYSPPPPKLLCTMVIFNEPSLSLLGLSKVSGSTLWFWQVRDWRFFSNQSKQLPQKHQVYEFETKNFCHRLCRKRISSRRKNTNMTLLQKNCLSCFIGALSGVERIKSWWTKWLLVLIWGHQPSFRTVHFTQTTSFRS